MVKNFGFRSLCLDLGECILYVFEVFLIKD